MGFQKWENRLLVSVTVMAITFEALLVKAFLPVMLPSSGMGSKLHGLAFAGSSFLLVIAAFVACLYIARRADLEREAILRARLDRWVRPR